MIPVRRGVLAGVFAVSLAAAGLLAATVAAGATGVLSSVTTGTTGTTGTTTTAASLIAPGVTIGGVPVGGLTPDDAYIAVSDSFSRPLVLVIRSHRLAPQPAQLGSSARVGEAVARAGSALPGTRVPLDVIVKWRNPWWYPPNSPWARGLKPIPPGPGNPLGTRWMGLSAPGVGIHGTPDDASIGYSLSHGCIRMHIPDAEWLFEHVNIGTTVFIV